MFLSILVPNYGFSELTVRCFQSLKSQVKNNNIEIIICDQSDDLSKKKLLELTKVIPNVKVITLNKPDVLLARKTLLQEASGDYIFFVDSDDYVDEGFADQLLSKIIENDYPDLLVTSYYLESSKSIAKNDDLSFINDSNFDKYFYCSDLVNTLWRKIFKRLLFNPDDISNLESTNGDDWIISLPVVKNAKSRCFEPALCGYHYCMNDSSLTHTMTLERFKKSFALKDVFLESYENVDYKLLFKSKMSKFSSFCVLSYRQSKDKNIIKSSFIFVRNNIFNVLKIPRNAACGFKQKTLYFLIKHNLFSLFFIAIKRAAKKL